MYVKGANFMEINALAIEANKIAMDKGWWDDNHRLPETLAICHAALSEALKEYQTNMPILYVSGGADTHKPEGIAVSMADCMIRILDWFGHMNIEPSEIIQMKMNYNKSLLKRGTRKDV